jgi:hypothetical protein
MATLMLTSRQKRTIKRNRGQVHFFSSQQFYPAPSHLIVVKGEKDHEDMPIVVAVATCRIRIPGVIQRSRRL